MKNILFVCTGNTCRSPMAEFILKGKLKEAGIRNIRVSSAGLAAEPGAKMSALAKEVLRENKVRTYAFSSRQATADLIARQNLVLVMTARHKAALSGMKNVYTLAEIAGTADVPDPYGGTLADYRETFAALSVCCDRLLGVLSDKE